MEVIGNKKKREPVERPADVDIQPASVQAVAIPSVVQGQMSVSMVGLGTDNILYAWNAESMKWFA